ncbi:hypothetical protein BVY01_01400 [bacterium I07]|nr:hypothetical protein BVY01_01400 [bacterium I07]
MHRIHFMILSLMILSPVTLQATFSIVAVDTITGEVGGVIASCYDEWPLITIRAKPGIGVFIAQADAPFNSLTKAPELIEKGLSPDSILQFLISIYSDDKNKLSQYGIAVIEGVNRTASFTGSRCPSWDGHIVGPYYTLQGNSLAGEHILLNMEQAFLNTNGTLADRLMAALLAAKEVGADKRCRESSSLCAGITVSQPTDRYLVNSLSLGVVCRPSENDPIDSLKIVFDEWKQSKTFVTNLQAFPNNFLLYQNYPNPFNPSTTISYQVPTAGHVAIEIFNMMGRRIRTLLNDQKRTGSYDVIWDGRNDFGEIVENGIYVYQMQVEGYVQRRKMTFLK